MAQGKKNHSKVEMRISKKIKNKLISSFDTLASIVLEKHIGSFRPKVHNRSHTLELIDIISTNHKL
jgi:hypothetical protein